jgi:formylmethanofuran dehydrogenase subunit A
LRLWGALPSPRELAEAYALLGYTHIHEPGLTLATANYVHHELAAIPIMDTSASLTLNLRDFDLWLQDGARLSELGQAWGYLLENSRALNLRVVEPFVRYRQDFYQHRQLPLEAVLDSLLQIVGLAGLPLTLEATPELLAAELPALPALHLSGLGTALINEALLDRARYHLANGLSGDMGLLLPALRPGLSNLAVTIDLGWYRPFNLNHAPSPEVARRALCLALSISREKLAFSAAHPAQTPVSSFPRLFAWLGSSRSREQDWGERLAPDNYSIMDWLNSTRTQPARVLGLADRGHLGPGARADLALYELPEPGTAPAWPESFRHCRLLFKAGELVVQNGAVVQAQFSKTTYYRRTRSEPNQLVTAICRNHSFRLENLLVRPRPDLHWQQVQ